MEKILRLRFSEVKLGSYERWVSAMPDRWFSWYWKS